MKNEALDLSKKIHRQLTNLSREEYEPTSKYKKNNLCNECIGDISGSLVIVSQDERQIFLRKLQKEYRLLLSKLQKHFEKVKQIQKNHTKKKGLKNIINVDMFLRSN